MQLKREKTHTRWLRLIEHFLIIVGNIKRVNNG
jgi:hypothetical protein